MRTSLLMNTGFVIGTGDVSELALGWCTYNADHMSMYNPNVSIPKTLVKFLVRWAAENEFDGEARARPCSTSSPPRSRRSCCPPARTARSCKRPRATIGPYELHDFFLFHFLRYGTPPEKILFLAEHARFDRAYPRGRDAAAGCGCSCGASSPTSSSARACPTARRSARSACRRAATGACRATPRRRCGLEGLE